MALLQQVLSASEPCFWEPDQAAMAFPQSIPERYQPAHPSQFVGLTRPKALLTGLIAKPRPCALFFVGPPGSGKTAMGMALAAALGSLHHVSAQKCDVAALDALRDRFAYSPPVGKFWVPLVDEADQMTEKAQLQLLSRLDGTAALKPTFGGGFERGEPQPIIWVFTANSTAGLAPRFLSRCMVVEFASPASDMPAYLEHIWNLEGGGATPDGYFDYVADGLGVRDALQRIESDLLCGPRPRPVIVQPKPTLIALVPAKSRSDAANKAWATRRARMA